MKLIKIQGGNDMDVSQYLEIFLDETKEHLASLNTHILSLEECPDDTDTINEIFRAAHSLKGMSGTMGYKRMQTVTHEMENVFSEVRNGALAVESSMIDILFQCLDALEEYLNQIIASGDEGANDNEPLVKALQGILKNEDAKTKEEPKKKEKKASTKKATKDADKKQKWDEIEFNSTEKMVCQSAIEMGEKIYGITVFVRESCLLKAARAFLVFRAIEDFGDIIVSNPPTHDIEDEKFELEFTVIVISHEELDKILAAIKNVSEIEDAIGAEMKIGVAEGTEGAAVVEDAVTDTSGDVAKAETTPATKSETRPKVAKPVVNRTVRVDLEKLDVLMNLVSELIIAKNALVSTAGTDQKVDGPIQEHIEYIETVTTNLHESVMRVRMVSIESVVSKFPRMIRDLTKKLDKKMELVMIGEDTELDRTVVDEIGDPLMHLLRNSADHGLESNEDRVKKGKPEVGTITLNAFQDGNNVIIEVKDDGGGINENAVGKKAIERGIITPEQLANMEHNEIVNLIFQPGFSTAEVISDVSGRGVGLDVVRSKIEGLSGEVSVESITGVGSTFTIRLPLTLAIIQALMVNVGNEKYAISLSTIQTIEDVQASDINLVHSKEAINLRGMVVPIIRLDKLLDIETQNDPDANMIVVIVKKGEKTVGIVVDELDGQQDIVIKTLGKSVSKCKYISGATVLGDGEIALILDTNALI